ncbi:hypothetical protein GJ633_05610 [Halorubrum sp. CBA1125]|uniref:hypothetical protein n=1 Tax=Halorubrum sp. CBA1125 TaxID=2668072 RepID=UPI0012E80B2F|nr:hypothetical protein [Halorubrum sp. CBA1125]MUW14192.1 hypothetical protein [Halorubrum sp. CBA1125]
MNRRHFVAVATMASLAGCTGSFDGGGNSRLALTVQNERADPVTVRIEVVDTEGTTYEDESDRIDGGVARSYEVTGGTAGRHEVTVAGEGFRGQLAWNADTCSRFDGTVSVTDESVSVAGECVDQR